VVESPHNLVDDHLHNLLVLRHRPLQEPIDVANRVCQVWSRVDEIAKAPHKRRYCVVSTSSIMLSRLSFSLSSIGVRAGLQSVSATSSTMCLA
jgi:hypothetical protein